MDRCTTAFAACAQGDAEDKFWKWFEEHEAALFSFDPTDEATREELFDNVTEQLQRVHPDLTFEFGPNGN